MTDTVVVTGMGLVTSLGPSVSETWDALIAGKSGIHRITSFDADGFACPYGAEVHGLGPEELNIHPRDSRIMDRHAYMLLRASRDAFAASRLDTGSFLPEDIGFFAGMGMVDYHAEDLLPSVLKARDRHGVFKYDRFFSGGYQEIHPLWSLSMLNNISFCQVAIDLTIKGENTVFSPHGDSGIHAIIEAYHVVRERKARAALAGGVSEKISPQSLARAALSGTPSGADGKDTLPCQPFGTEREGTVPGEGCGIIALELAASAQQRGVPGLAFLTGYGTACERTKDANCPTSRAIRTSMQQALAKAGLTASAIDVLIAHGDGADAGDRNEADAIHEVFNDRIGQLPVYTSKSAVGNLLAGAPAADFIFGICMLRNGIIPPVYGAYSVDKDVRFSLVQGEAVKAAPGRIMINTRSYEGQSASLIIEKAE